MGTEAGSAQSETGLLKSARRPMDLERASPNSDRSDLPGEGRSTDIKWSKRAPEGG